MVVRKGSQALKSITDITYDKKNKKLLILYIGVEFLSHMLKNLKRYVMLL